MYLVSGLQEGFIVDIGLFVDEMLPVVVLSSADKMSFAVAVGLDVVIVCKI